VTRYDLSLKSVGPMRHKLYCIFQTISALVLITMQCVFEVVVSRLHAVPVSLDMLLKFMAVDEKRDRNEGQKGRLREL
jgi:hypothetical protein